MKNSVRFYLQYHSFFSRLAKGILVKSQVLLCHLVDMIVGTLTGLLHHLSSDRHHFVRVGMIYGGYGDSRIAGDVALLEPSVCSIDKEMVPVDVYPDGRHLWRSVLHQCRQVREILAFKELCHRCSLYAIVHVCQ